MPYRPAPDYVRARALRLRAEGQSYRAIARALGVGVASVHRWCNPESDEHHKATSRAWKARNQPAVRDYNREYAHRPCPNCGCPMSRKRSVRCEGCRAAIAAVRQTLTEGMWADGWLLREIHEALGWRVGSVVAMRARGWDLPHRYNVRNGKRVAA